MNTKDYEKGKKKCRKNTQKERENVKKMHKGWGVTRDKLIKMAEKKQEKLVTQKTLDGGQIK